MAFLAALRRAVRAQLRLGKEVVIAGDFNLTHRPVDTFWKDRILDLRRLFREPRGEDDEDSGADAAAYPLPEPLQQRCGTITPLAPAAVRPCDAALEPPSLCAC